MEINLRKANAVQAEIRRALSAVQVNDKVTVNEYTVDTAAEVAKVTAEFEAAVVRKAGLTNALFNIRKAVASANATAGVNVILTDVERIDALIAIEQSVAVQKVGMSLVEINARLEKFRNAPAQDARSAIYGDRYNNVETSVVTEQAVVSAKQEVKNLRRQRQNLQDKLLALNINTNITLSAEDEAILREEGIV